ncbi:hypothetical protein PUN28_019218 [Cardiocondyla obscurior]|uniref:Uncharacterized protein n=1 Tax=Cardiocondyla obscurior TaxID=286306 RepID=A0AAW2EBQ3_9HYME
MPVAIKQEKSPMGHEKQNVLARLSNVPSKIEKVDYRLTRGTCCSNKSGFILFFSLYNSIHDSALLLFFYVTENLYIYINNSKNNNKRNSAFRDCSRHSYCCCFLENFPGDHSFVDRTRDLSLLSVPVIQTRREARWN